MTRVWWSPATSISPSARTGSPRATTKNAPKYNSQELDKESGYYFYNARHYDPEIGRFVTPDTVIDGELSTQGWNRFAYVHNNPIRYKDPTGHMKIYPKGLEPNPKPDPISQLLKDAADDAKDKMFQAKEKFLDRFNSGKYDAKTLAQGGKAIYYAVSSFFNEKASNVLSGKSSSLELLSGRTGGATEAKAISKEISKTINEKTTNLATKIPNHNSKIDFGKGVLQGLPTGTATASSKSEAYGILTGIGLGKVLDNISNIKDAVSNILSNKNEKK